MRRRDFIKVVAGSAIPWPLALRAQQSVNMPTIGFLGANTPSTANEWVSAFVRRLNELGWNEGRTVAINYQWAEGRSDRAAEIASEFARLKVDVIVTYGTPQTVAAKQATSIIPIVFATVGDPVGTGLVASLAHPGGNITGLSNEQSDIASKRLALLHEVLPDLRRLAILANAGALNALLDMREVQAASRKFDFEVLTSEVRRAEDIAQTLDALRGRADALYVCTDPLLTTNRNQIANLALTVRLPTMLAYREYVEAGGLMSYGTNVPQQFRRAAEYVDMILRGKKPGDIPIEQPTKFDLAVNLKTAKALGLSIPVSFLARADEVIE
jgi:putative tryptophan/tyrosine transport system substrate-binding protein